MFRFSLMSDLAAFVNRGVASMFGSPLDERAVAAIVARAVKAREPEHYAFRAGRNRAIDAIRRKAAASKRARQADLQEAIDAAVAFIRNEVTERCTAELRTVLDRLASGPTPGRMSDHLLVVQAAYLEGIALRDLYPSVPAATLYQWKRRGLKLVLPHASQELSYWLDRHVPCEV